MKLFSLLALAISAVISTAQDIKITRPADYSSVTGGQALTVELERRASSIPINEVAVVIGFYPCFSGYPLTCPSVDPYGIGKILYNGPFDPSAQYIGVTIPDELGPAVLGVTHFAFTGENNIPFVQNKNITIYVE